GTTGWASGTWFAPVNAHSVMQHILFLGDYDYSRYNTAFWSLVYEMRISIIFPAMFLVMNKLRLRYAAILVAASILIGIRASATVEYASIFMVGILFAKNLNKFGEVYKSAAAWKRWLIVLVAF